jgi:hypothetical protein
MIIFSELAESSPERAFAKHSAGLKLNQEEDVIGCHAAPGEYLDSEEVHACPE